MNSIIITRYRKMADELDIRAYFDIIINGISIHGLKLIRSKKNIGQLYLGFPSEKDKTFISKAAEFARKAHGSQKRDSGEPYICHPMDVALTLAGMGLDASTVIAGIFHDVVEDTPTTVEEIKIKWGFEVAFLVNGVTKLSKIQYSGKEAQAETLRKMFLAMAEDIRVVLIKLADRYHNMMTLDSLSPERQKKISLEEQKQLNNSNNLFKERKYLLSRLVGLMEDQ